MELIWLDDFIILEKTRNFTRAANERFTTQSAYSRRIQRLEEWIGAELFIRDTRPVGLTRAGEEFAKRAVRLREDIYDIRRITANASTKIPGALRIYTTNTLAIGFLPAWIKAQNIKHYTLVVSNVSTCIDALNKGHCNISFIPDLLEDLPVFSYQQDAVFKDELVLCVIPEMRNAISIKKNIIEGPMMSYSPGTAFGQFIMKNLHQNKISLPQKPICESASAEALLAQVRAGLGAAWLPKMLLNKDEHDCIISQKLSFPYHILKLSEKSPMASYAQ